MQYRQFQPMPHYRKRRQAPVSKTPIVFFTFALMCLVFFLVFGGRYKPQALPSLPKNLAEQNLLQQVSATFSTKNSTNLPKATGDSVKTKVDKTIIVMLDPGHGGIDGGSPAGETNEKDIVLSIALKTHKLFSRPESTIKSLLTRSSDELIDKAMRPQMANEQADLFVSIHCNAYEASKDPYGVVTYYDGTITPTTGLTDISNQSFATIIQSHLVNQLETRDRGLVGNEQLAVLSRSTVPAVLLEVGYLTNPEEQAKLKTDAYQNLVAQAIYDGIYEAVETNIKQ